jgi:hypothetical protein
VDEVEDVALLLTEGRMHGQNAFDEATALLGVRPVAGFATEHSAIFQTSLAHQTPARPDPFALSPLVRSNLLFMWASFASSRLGSCGIDLEAATRMRHSNATT